MFRSIIFLAILLAATTMAIAQPTDAEVKKQMTNSGVLEIKLDGKGIRQWNSDLNNYEYVRNVKIIRSSEYPGIKLSVNGDAVYQYMGNGSYKYWKFRVIDNSYLGVPNPNTREIFGLLASDWPRYYGSLYNAIVKIHTAPEMDATPGWLWHDINSVEFRTHLKYDKITSNTEIETVDEVRAVRLYRDDIKQPWKTFIPNAGDMGEERSLGIKTVSQAEMENLKKQTLEFTMGEQIAKEQLGTTGIVPAFTTPLDLVKYIHHVLRTGNEQQLRAVLVSTLDKTAFIEGSKVQLNTRGESLVNNAIEAAYKGQWKYADQYCETFELNKENTSPKNDIISGCIKDLGTPITVIKQDGGYVEGVPVATYKVFSLRVYVRQDNDATVYLNSFSDKTKLCPADSKAPTSFPVASTLPPSGNWGKGAKVMVEEDGKWYSSTVLDTRPGEWFIHYDGYDSKYDLWVGPARIKNK